MKLFIMSDIHGSLSSLHKALEAFEREQADSIILLGDLMYHGPRNPLPDAYKPSEVATKLNTYKERIIAVRGNCDAEVDQMLVEFPILSEYAVVFYEGRRIYVTHGHHHHMDKLPPLTAGDIFIQGHTHVPVADRRGDIIVLNPGSISLPKEGHPPSYGVFEGLEFRICEMDGTVMMKLAL